MSSPASASRCACPGSCLISSTEVYDGTGGPAPRTLDPRIDAACRFGPPALQKRQLLPLPPIWSMDLSLWMLVVALHLCFRYFPTNRAGASNPGDGNISYGTEKPGNARSTAAVREGSTVKTLSPAASPRPRHRSPSLARQPASLLLAWTFWVDVHVDADGGGGSLPYTPPQCARSTTAALQGRASLRPPVPLSS